jgi:hypothetical protein
MFYQYVYYFYDVQFCSEFVKSDLSSVCSWSYTLSVYESQKSKLNSLLRSVSEFVW